MRKDLFLKTLIYVPLVIFFSLFFSQKIHLVTQDLGRHITNGRIFIEKGIIVSTNYYSYTEPTFEAINHHWLSGVIFYLVHKVWDFKGLSLFYLLISGLTVFFFFQTAKYKSDFNTAFLITFLLIPLLSDRKEIRPEGFSYLFLGIYYYLLTLYYDKKIPFKPILPTILLIQLIWVNTHIFFIFGIFIITLFLVNHFIKTKEINRELTTLLVSSILVSLVNPYGISGLVEPFNIFRSYGYLIVENMSVFFMQKRAPEFKYIYVEILAIVWGYFAIHITLNKEIKKHFIHIVLTVVFMLMAFKINRIIPIFAMVLIPYIAEIFYEGMKDYGYKIPQWIIPTAILISLIPGHYYSLLKPGIGIGLAENINASADFFRETHIKGPIFNNYDIGGYLIYHLPDGEKVFVDNRPEAYSVSFFEDIYIPMQEKENIWEQMDKKYGFNTIYFYRRDATPWAQPFLIRRIQDAIWVPIFVDNYTLIVIKNIKENEDIIKKHALPKEIFITT